MQTFHFDMLQEANLSTKVTMDYNIFPCTSTLIKYYMLRCYGTYVDINVD